MLTCKETIASVDEAIKNGSFDGDSSSLVVRHFPLLTKLACYHRAAHGYECNSCPRRLTLSLTKSCCHAKRYEAT